MNEYLLHRLELKNGKPPDPKPAKKGIAKRSKKMIKEKKELGKLYGPFLEKNPVCNIQIDENCTYFATTVNHLRRRGANVFNEEDWEPCCSYCNTAIENKDEWARENGHLKSKFK